MAGKGLTKNPFKDAVAPKPTGKPDGAKRVTGGEPGYPKQTSGGRLPLTVTKQSDVKR